MKKKIIALTLAAVLLMIAVVGGTYAYLKDTDGAKNVMTVGNVMIEQIETMKDGTAFVNNTQKLIPAEYTATPVEGTDGLLEGVDNEIDKFVSVKNTGTEAAYIRTIFLFEADGGNADAIDVVHYSDDQSLVWPGFTVTIDSVIYHVAYATYANPVAKDDTTAYSLKQLYLDNNAGNEWYEAVNGSYDIYAFSQAVQSEGFENADEALAAAFGELNAANVVAWFNTVDFTPAP